MALIAGHLKLRASGTPILEMARDSTDRAGVLNTDTTGTWQHVDGHVPQDQLAALSQTWRQRGTAALDKLTGSWAMARWDPAGRTLWLARDPFGTRPLFWARQGDQVAFASDIGTLCALPWVSRDPAIDHLAEYLSFRYVHSPATLLRDVSSVPPGH
ncbi:MAG: hypothetical protein GXP62_01255, partial [Oligoflexia bacterium]|nr:hypothetical protein [Oligoflexia bacterium]